MDETMWVGVNIKASVEVPSDGDEVDTAEDIVRRALLSDDRIKLAYSTRQELLIER